MPRYCPYCKRLVEPQKKFNWAIFLLGLLTVGIISFIYLIYYLLKTPTKCPICGAETVVGRVDVE